MTDPDDAEIEQREILPIRYAVGRAVLTASILIPAFLIIPAAGYEYGSASPESSITLAIHMVGTILILAVAETCHWWYTYEPSFYDQYTGLRKRRSNGND